MWGKNKQTVSVLTESSFDMRIFACTVLKQRKTERENSCIHVRFFKMFSSYITSGENSPFCTLTYEYIKYVFYFETINGGRIISRCVKNTSIRAIGVKFKCSFQFKIDFHPRASSAAMFFQRKALQLSCPAAFLVFVH